MVQTEASGWPHLRLPPVLGIGLRFGDNVHSHQTRADVLFRRFLTPTAPVDKAGR